MATIVSTLENSVPGHILGPPPNGKKVWGAIDDRLSNRDGSNLVGSLKNLESKCVMLCAEKTYQVMRQKHVNGF